jgi:hypothetical protein
MNHLVAHIRDSHVKELMELQVKIEGVRGDINAITAAINSTEKANNSSMLLHKHSGAVLALEGALTSNAPFTQELEAVKNTADGDALVLAVVDSIPERIHSNGAPTLGNYISKHIFKYIKSYLIIPHRDYTKLYILLL